MTDRLALIRPLQRVLQGPSRRQRLRREREEMSQLISEMVEPDDLVFDVGAHSGEMTALFLMAGARVLAIEPQPELSEQLKDRFAGQRVVVIDRGVAEHPGTREMSISSESTLSTMEPDWKLATASSGRFGGTSWDRAMSVEVTTLDALIEHFGVPSFIKIDVEGFEEQVLRGLSRSVRAVSFEFVAERPLATEGCVRRLHGLGMTEFNFSNGYEGPALVEPEWLTASELLSRLRALDNALAMGDVYARVP